MPDNIYSLPIAEMKSVAEPELKLRALKDLIYLATKERIESLVQNLEEGP